MFKYDGTAAGLSSSSTIEVKGDDRVAEQLSGSASAETLWGASGDLLSGGGGDDSYGLLHPSARINEAPGQGTDSVFAWFNLRLADYPNVENVSVYNPGNLATGNALDNVVSGGADLQQLYGGAGGQDILVGGAGYDIFIVRKGEGNDVIQDFNPSEGDILRLSAGYKTFDELRSHMTQAGADVRIDFGGGEGVILRNLRLDQLGSRNFQLQFDSSGLGAATFSAEFDGPLSLWDAQSNPAGVWRPDYGLSSQSIYNYNVNNELQVYVSEYYRDHPGDFPETPFAVGPDGVLTITARQSSSPELFGKAYTSGLIANAPVFSQTYGYFEIRANPSETPGSWGAFWLAAADGSWPPEVDIMEAWGSAPGASLTAWHSGAGGHSTEAQQQLTPDTADGFHTYGLLWTPQNLTWYIDSVEVYRAATPTDMNKPMYLIANLAVTNKDGAVGATPFDLKIDYVRAYATSDTRIHAPAISAAPGTTVEQEAGVLRTAFANILHTDLGTAGGALITSMASQIASGQINRTEAIDKVVDLAAPTTEVALLTYQFFTGATPSEAGIDYLVRANGLNPNNLNSAYYQSFNLENRYINFATNLGKAGEGRAGFQSQYGQLSLFDATKQAYSVIFGAAPSDAKVHAMLDPTFVLNGATMSRADYFAYYGQDGVNGLGTKAAMVGWLLAEAVKVDAGTYARSADAYLADLADGADYQINLVGIYGRMDYVYQG